MTSAPKPQVKKFIASIKLYLKQAEIEPAELSGILGYDRRRVKNWITGTSNPSVEAIEEFTIKMKAMQVETDRNAAALDNFFLLFSPPLLCCSQQQSSSPTCLWLQSSAKVFAPQTSTPE
jgi:hypothetical protein